MEDDRRPDSTNELDEEAIETENIDDENPSAANEADPGGDVIIIK